MLSLITGLHLNVLAESTDNSYMDNDEITSRTNFPESWLWIDINLPACPVKSPDWCVTHTLIKRGRWWNLTDVVILLQ